MARDTCDVSCIHRDKVDYVKENMENHSFPDVGQIFKALADEKRLKIAYALMIEKELCVCDVANILDCSNATASHHLRQLRRLGLAKYRKDGKLAYYSLDDDHVSQLVEMAFMHSKEVKQHERTS
ncbi:ArsR/SmtB family transcription factor [Thalassobacillus pellis]|uniref:ArsR/SmtB family transcription factor n=1 Tax=Thalassobacillus pellis TaxID=748008 RepID=UPI001960F218|nr:metalloregulator ArsR/SmtB family transcription factor [Thalassobacillus pellis]MBM7554362.1 DNA-binding transcriptional ArsR family regulator [Thalassobacillus pellis]